MPGDDILSQLNEAFAPFIKSREELHNIRVQIAKYIESLQPREPFDPKIVKSLPIPAHVTGVRREYLNALYANIAAKHEYAQLRKEASSQPDSTTEPATSISTVKTYVNLQRLRRKHRKYQILTHYLAEAEKLAEQNNVYDAQIPIDISAFNLKQFNSPTVEDSAAAAHAQELIRNVQVAVLQATHDLKRERQLLEDVKIHDSQPSAPGPGAKLRALVATHAELTRWIEESLLKCDSVNGSDRLNGHHDNAKENDSEQVDHEQIISEHYEKYLQSRAELLDSASRLMAPLPATEPLPDPQPSTPGPTVSNTRLDQLPIFSYIDSHVLPLLNQQQTLSQSRAHLRSIMTNHTRDLKDQLLRLSEESHLLPSYPILAKPKATSDAEVDETGQLLHAWKFAMDAAGTATEAATEKQVKVADAAIQEVNDILDMLAEEEAMWEKLR